MSKPAPSPSLTGDAEEILRIKIRQAEERRAKQRQKMDEAKTKRALALMEQEEKLAEQAAERAMKVVDRMESAAEQRLAREAVKRGVKGVGDILRNPGLRSARSMNGAKPLAGGARGTGSGAGVSPSATAGPGRPQSPAGAVSFHFALTSITKGGALNAVLKGQRGAASPKGTAAAHERYVEREDAAERLGKANEAQAAGIQPGHEQSTGDGRTDDSDRDPAADGQAYIERAGAAETDAATDGIEVSSFGTIGDTPEERIAFWMKLEEAERSPGKATIRVTGLSDDDWGRVLNRIQEPQVAKAAEAARTSGAPEPVLKLDNDDALALLLATQRALGRERAKKALAITPGRGGRVQTRIVAELPHEMTPQQRLALAKAYTAEFERRGLPFWAVIHAPNEHNDSRNFHLHVNLSERPAKKMADPTTGEQVWDFEVVITKTFPNRHTRDTRPFMQRNDRELSTMKWVYAERKRFATLTNEALATALIDKRVDHRTYDEMGIDRAARERLAPAVYARERKGEITPAGVEEARRQWDANKVAIGKLASLDLREDRYRDSYYRAKTAFTGFDHTERTGVDDKLAELSKLAKIKRDLVLERNACQHVAAKLISRTRLKPKKQRSKADQIAIAVSEELRKDADRIDQKLDRVIRRAAVVHNELVKDVHTAKKRRMIGTFHLLTKAVAPLIESSYREAEELGLPREVARETATKAINALVESQTTNPDALAEIPLVKTDDNRIIREAIPDLPPRKDYQEIEVDGKTYVIHDPSDREEELDLEDHKLSLELNALLKRIGEKYPEPVAVYLKQRQDQRDGAPAPANRKAAEPSTALPDQDKARMRELQRRVMIAKNRGRER